MHTDNSEQSTIFKGEKMNGECNSLLKVNSTENNIKVSDKSLHRVKKINGAREDKMKLKKKRKMIPQSSTSEAKMNMPLVNGNSEHLNLSQKEIKSVKKKKINHLLEKVILIEFY